MKKLTNLICLILAIALTLGFTACGNGTKEENDGLKVEFVEINWNTKETSLENGTIDLIWNGLTITEERSAQMTISIPYLTNYQVAVVRKQDKQIYSELTAQNLTEKFKNAIIGVEGGSAGEEVVLKANGDLNFGKEVVKLGGQLDTLTQLKNGSIDVSIIDSVMAGYYSSTGEYKDDIAMLDYTFAEEFYGIAGRKQDKALISMVNQALVGVSQTQNAQYQSLVTKYNLNSCTLLKGNEENPLKDATDNSWNDVWESGKIIIGYTVFAPIAFDLVDGVPTKGFDIELANKVVEWLNNLQKNSK